MATLIFPLRQKVCVCLKMKVCVWREESKHMTAFLHEGKEGKDGRERASERTPERN